MMQNGRLRALVDHLCSSTSTSSSSTTTTTTRRHHAETLDVPALQRVASSAVASLTIVKSRQLSASDLMMGTAFIASDANRSHPDECASIAHASPPLPSISPHKTEQASYCACSARKVATVAYAIEQGIVDIDVYALQSMYIDSLFLPMCCTLLYPTEQVPRGVRAPRSRRSHRGSCAGRGRQGCQTAHQMRPHPRIL